MHGVGQHGVRQLGVRQHGGGAIHASGASRLCAEPGLVERGVRRGMLTNFAASMPDLTRSIDALIAAGVAVDCLFGPEHGLWGSARAGESEPGGVDAFTGLPVHDTYLLEDGALDALLAASGIRELLIDLQDFGTRYCTYLWSTFDLLASAARLGIAVVVLDRPNPLGSRPASGPGIAPGFESFVGRASIPIIHSSTLGELALAFNEREIPARAGRAADLRVIRFDVPGCLWPGTSDPAAWVPPSPNLPTAQTALVYPGMCLFEGTNVSEGRGTTRPFETIGAGWVDARFPAALREHRLPGVLFREVRFTPESSKWSGSVVRGVQLHVTDPLTFDPLDSAVTMLALLEELYPADFAFLPPGSGGRHFIDLLWGSDTLRTAGGRGLPWLLANSPTPGVTGVDLPLYDRVSWDSCTSDTREVT